MCDLNFKVVKFLSIGGPNMGVDKIPQCTTGWKCKFVNYLAGDVVYLPLVQQLIGPAGYYRDPLHLEAYLKHSNLLRFLNNEVDDGNNSKRKERV